MSSVRSLAWLGLLTVVFAGVGACGGPVVGAPEPAQSSAAGSSVADAVLGKLDPCTLLTTQELQQWGVSTAGKPLNSSDETGCGFSGYPDSLSMGISLTKSKDSVDSYVQRADTFVKLTQNAVNGRAGVQTQISQSNTECSQIIAVGSGDVVAAVDGDKSGDPCGNALKLAQLVEPRLPK